MGDYIIGAVLSGVFCVGFAQHLSRMRAEDAKKSEAVKNDAHYQTGAAFWNVFYVLATVGCGAVFLYCLVGIYNRI